MLKRYHAETDGATDDRPAFELLPAIDLRGGRVVRLVQGDFDRETSYASDPAAVARDFAEQGARWLHVVDLDGARDGRGRQAQAIRAIAASVGERTRVELAGGLRTEREVSEAFEVGAARAVIGTAALADPGFARRLVARHGSERIVAAIDVRDGQAVGHAWRTDGKGIPMDDAVRSLTDAGVRIFEVTSVVRDGGLEGPDVELLSRVIDLVGSGVIASGGIASIDDIRAVRELGCAGVIVGRALYEGRFTVGKALAAISA